MTPRSTVQEQQLSSVLTFVCKFIVPTLWVGSVGVVTVLLVIKQSGPPPLALAAILVVGAIFFYRWGFSLKRVIATERGLRVSNFRSEIVVVYDQISSVRENKFLNIRPITVELRSPSYFGSSFTFMPYAAFVVFGDHPVATLLRGRAEAARQEHR